MLPRRSSIFTLILSAMVSIPALAQDRNQGLPETSEQDKPAFLQPPPMERLRQGLAPLAEELPDSDVRPGLMPPDASRGLFGQRWASSSRGDQWVPTEFHWLPSCNRYRPTYFEDTMLERHGQSRHCLVQPAMSGARFFGSIAAMPYAVVVDPPWQVQSSLGHFRPGSGAPCLLQRPPLQVDAGLFEAGLAVGLIFIVP